MRRATARAHRPVRSTPNPTHNPNPNPNQECALSEGDQINLVVEEAVAGTGRSLEWSGNPCAYRVNFVETSAATAKARLPP